MQFHPEVTHTTFGTKILENFVKNICGLSQNWTMKKFAEEKIKEMKAEIGDEKVLCALSGGVDSSVAAVLMHRAIGENLVCIFVDHGLMRKNEGDEVERVFKNTFHMNFIRVNAQKRFLDKLAGLLTLSAKGKSSARSLSAFLKKRLSSWRALNICCREPFIPMSLRAVRKTQR